MKTELKCARIHRWIREHVPGSALFDERFQTAELERAYQAALQGALDGLPSAQSPSRQTSNAGATLVRERLPLVLVSGPWGGGTSAVAGALARAGLQAPGPYVTTNDPRTSNTYEMMAFRALMRDLASEKTMQRHVTFDQALDRLRQFRDTMLLPSIQTDAGVPPLMLKHALSALFLRELSLLFDVKIVGVLRPLPEIEATRARRGWGKSFGRKGAEVLYQNLFECLVASDTPFHLIRYSELLKQPGDQLDAVLRFCRFTPTAHQRADALEFIIPSEVAKALA